MIDLSTISQFTKSQSALQLSNERFKAYEKKQQRTEQKASEKQGILDQLREQQQEAQRKQKVDDLDARLKNGQDLTQEEVAYLQKERPGLYEERMKERQEQESYRKALENADTKDDVDKLHMARLSQYMTETNTVMYDPVIDKSKKLEIIQNIEARLELTEKATLRFKKSGEYEDLPDDENEKLEAERADTLPANGQADAAGKADAGADTAPADNSGRTSGGAADAASGSVSEPQASPETKRADKSVKKGKKANASGTANDAEALTSQLLTLLRSAKTAISSASDRLDVLT